MCREQDEGLFDENMIENVRKQPWTFEPIDVFWNWNLTEITTVLEADRSVNDECGLGEKTNENILNRESKISKVWVQFI